MTYTPKHRILVTLDDKDFALLPDTTDHGKRMNWMREAFMEKAIRHGTKIKVQAQGAQRCPSCNEMGIVWQPYGMKCVFCGYCQYFKKGQSK